MSIEPTHHKQYREAWESFLEDGDREEMDALRELFGWTEFLEFKKTLPMHEELAMAATKRLVETEYRKQYREAYGGPRYRKKSEEVKAVQWLGDHPNVRFEGQDICCTKCGKAMREHGWLASGSFLVCPGDYVITDDYGVQYPCKPDIFALTYEELV